MGEEQRVLTKHHTENTEAYQAYLIGRFHWNKRTGEGLKKAIERFIQAITIDPNFALAYTGLADCYIVLAGSTIIPPNEAFPRAKEAATKALELDSTLGEAHASLGSIAEYDRDWAKVGQELQRAIELSPNYATAHQWYGEYLQFIGRMDEAVAALRRAIELDPLSLIINKEMGEALFNARRYDEALDQFRETLEIDPNFFPVHAYIGMIHLQKKMHEEAMASFQKLRSISGGKPSGLALIGYTYAITGKSNEARAALEELKELSKHEYVPPFALAVIHMGLQDTDQVFSLLQRACEERDNSPWSVKVLPIFDSLRADPRYVELFRCLRLPQ
jgi:tetratricopeptide (TPR) repeat protein